MTKFKLLFVILCVVVTGCSQSTQPPIPSEFRLIDDVAASEDRLVIPYKKYQMKNGLTVILHQDNSDPLVHVDVTYHVGSAREELGKSGFAHFFEHMMFQGSENVADEQHFKIITEAGGTMNGTTNSDRTNYYQTVPANQLEKVLWLESDRMGFLLDAVTQEKFEVQRETVKNERGQRVDNAPYGLLNERVSEALYPHGHPYSWPVIGYIDDLNRVDVTDLKAFFLRWYGPNNATLTIGGDIDEAQTLAWVEKYFAAIPAGPTVEDAEYQPVTLNEDRYLSMQDNVHLPLLYISYPTVRARHADEAALDILANILGGGKTSLLYKNLVKTGDAVQAGVSHPCRELSCQFNLYALPNPSKMGNLAEMEAVINQTLSEFEQRGVNDDDLIKTKVQMETNIIYGLQSVAGKVSTLAFNQTFGNNPDQVQSELDRYNKVTKADVMDVYRRYIKDNHKVVFSIVPKGQIELIAREDTYQFPGRQIGEVAPIDPESLTIRKAVSSFDRSVVPPIGANPQITVPDIWRDKFDNGIEVIGHQSAETPTVSILLSLDGGPLLDGRDKAGLAALTAAMMNESTKNFTTEQIANELELIGSRISFSAGGRYTYIDVQTLSKNIDTTVMYLAEKLLHPKFDQDDFNRVKSQFIESVKQNNKRPGSVGNAAFKQVLYGVDNRVSLADMGTESTLANIELDDVKQFYQRYYSPAKANMVIVGDVGKNAILAKLEYLQQWRGDDYVIPAYNPFPVLDSAKIYFVEQENAAQSVIAMGYRTMPFDATGEFFKATLMNFNLGGNFNSRINLNLREDKGYTYGAGSYFSGGKSLGSFKMSANVNKDHTADAIEEMLNELTRYRAEGITPDELEFMRSSVSQGDALSYETPGQKSGFLRNIITFDLSVDFVEQRNEIIETISLEEINASASRWLKPDQLQIIVVGDKEQVMPQLKTLPYDIVELSILP